MNYELPNNGDAIQPGPQHSPSSFSGHDRRRSQDSLDAGEPDTPPDVFVPLAPQTFREAGLVESQVEALIERVLLTRNV